MTNIDEQRIAKEFHETYERLAPEHGYLTRSACNVPWSAVPANNKSLMRAVVRNLIDRKVIST